MQLETASEVASLRFDRGLKAFLELIDSYLILNAKPVSATGKIVAKGPLSPADIYYAAGATPYDFNTHQPLKAIFSGNSSYSQQAVDRLISSEFSPWLLVMLGAYLAGQNEVPIDLFSPSLGEFDDQLTKSFQFMANSGSKPFIAWEVPRYEPASEKHALDYLKKELKQLFVELGHYTGQKVSDDSLRSAIEAGNLLRSDMAEIDSYLALSNIPLSGLEYYLLQIMLGDYARDPEGLHKQLRKLIEELKQRVHNQESAPGVRSCPVRIYIMGDETQELHLYNAIEDSGGVLVGCDFRLPLYYELIESSPKPLEGLARWIWRMPNNLPIQQRITFELNIIKKQKPDAIILSNVVGSRHLTGVERLVKDMVKEELGVPVLSIETTLAMENIDKIDYQINALMQTIGG
jgi:benzoyl-CoA reductase/2-hydroxyglutaryl-CoA dehydratase subunit BcrC/BadD/HgdB